MGMGQFQGWLHHMHPTSPAPQAQGAVRSVRMGVPNARKTDGSELRNTLERTGHGKGAESAERSEEKGEMRNIYRRGERLGLSLCAVPSPHRIWGSFNLRTDRVYGTMKGL